MIVTSKVFSKVLTNRAIVLDLLISLILICIVEGSNTLSGNTSFIPFLIIFPLLFVVGIKIIFGKMERKYEKILGALVILLAIALSIWMYYGFGKGYIELQALYLEFAALILLLIGGIGLFFTS